MAEKGERFALGYWSGADEDDPQPDWWVPISFAPGRGRYTERNDRLGLVADIEVGNGWLDIHVSPAQAEEKA